MDAAKLKVYLPFDTSTTQDLCGNSWTTSGSPTIDGGALKLNGSSYLQCNEGITLGGQDFSVGCKFSGTSNSTGGEVCLWQFYIGNADRFHVSINTAGILTLWKDSDSTVNITTSNSVLDGRKHLALCVYSSGTWYLFLDGQLAGSQAHSFAAKTYTLYIGNNYATGRIFTGSISDFMIFDGVALHTENFTPPTDSDYAELKVALGGNFTVDVERQISNQVEFNADVERRFLFRYVNLGDADDLITSSTALTDFPTTQSKTGSAFYQTAREKCFDLPATDEIWIKFDVYFNGSQRWRAYNGGTNGITGITAQDSGGLLSLFANDTFLQNTENICKTNQLQTVLLHMISGSSDGVIEAWVDGSLIYSYSGDVNHGDDFADIYLQSDGAGTFFSNVVISNKRLTQADGFNSFSADIERRIKNLADFSVDVERRVKNIIDVEFSADVERSITLPVDLTFDIARTLIKSVELAADVEILDVIPVEFDIDVARNILTKVVLFPTDTGEYFSGGTEPIVIPPMETATADDINESTIQSMEISISEQQLTDQVKLVGIVPFDILFPVQGFYLDYQCDMRAEKVQRQGVLYSAECCSDIDELIFTPLNYDLPRVLTIKTTSSDVEQPQYITVTLPVEASKHVEKFADALNLQAVMEFDDFYSSVEVPAEKTGGATYSDLIRDIFGWSARIPTMLINAYIRAGKLYVIQRGHEANVIDISDSIHSLPTFTHELVRMFYQRQKFSETKTREFKYTVIRPVHSSREISDGNTESSYEYDDDDLLQRTETTTTNADGSIVRTVTTYEYNTLRSGKKVLVREITEKYVDDELDETTETKHTPLKQGLSHQVKTDEDGDIVAEGVGQNSADDRVTPYSKFQSDNYEAETETVTTDTTIEGLTLIDTSFPIQTKAEIDDSHWDGELPPGIVNAMNAVNADKGINRLKQITAEIKRLNRRTQETVTLSVYNFPHFIDFNDRIILDGNEYFLVSNRAQTTAHVFNEQALTLRRWF